MSDVRRSITIRFFVSNTAMVVNFLTGLVLARLLSPEDVGLFSMTAVFVGIMHTFRDFGVVSYLLREKDLTPEKIRAASGLLIATSWVIAIALLLLARPVADFYEHQAVSNVMHVLAMGFFLIPFGSVTEALLRRNLEAGKQAIATAVSTVAYSTSCITLAALDFGYMSMAWANFINILCSVLVYSAMRPADQPWLPSLRGWRGIIGFSGASALSNLMTNIHNALADTLLAKQVDARSVGLYSRANALVELFSQIMMPAINNSAVPILARSFHEKGDISADLNRTVSYITGLAWPILIVTALFAEDMIRVLYGDKWLDCLPIVIPLCIASAARAPFLLTTSALMATGRPYLSVLTIGGTILLKLVMALLLHANDLRGFAVAFMTADLLALPLFVGVWKSQFRIHTMDLARSIMPSLFVTLLCGLMALGFRFMSRGYDPMLRVLCLTAIMSLTWISVVALVRHPLREEISELFRKPAPQIHQIVSTRILKPSDLSEAQRQRWNELLLAAPVQSAFLSWAYSHAAEQAFGNTRVCVIESATGSAFFPFSFEGKLHRWIGSAIPVGGNFSDYVGMVASSDFNVEPAGLLRATGLNTLLFTHLDESQKTFGLDGTQPTRGLRIRAAGKDFITELYERDKKFSQDTERRMKKLAREQGELRFSVEDPHSDTLDWLIDMKISQYRRTGKTRHPFASQTDRDFLKILSQQNDPLCRPRLTALYCGERRVAAHFGLQCADTLAYWFPVYEPELHSYSPGRLLLWETLRHAESLGIRCVDRGEGDTQAKRDFANEEHHYLRGYYARRGLCSLVDRGINALRWRLQSHD